MSNRDLFLDCLFVVGVFWAAILLLAILTGVALSLFAYILDKFTKHDTINTIKEVDRESNSSMALQGLRTIDD